MKNANPLTQPDLPGLPPGVIAEVSPAEAERMGAFDETAIDPADALAAASHDAAKENGNG